MKCFLIVVCFDAAREAAHARLFRGGGKNRVASTDAFSGSRHRNAMSSPFCVKAPPMTLTACAIANSEASFVRECGLEMRTPTLGPEQHGGQENKVWSIDRLRNFGEQSREMGTNR